jgi:hypothetical protein
MFKSRVLKPGLARRIDPGLGPVRVEAKTHSGIGPGNSVDPGPGPPGQTRVRPGQFFFIFTVIKRRCFLPSKMPKR